MEQFIYWFNRLVVWSMMCQEMVKNVDHCFPKAQDDIKCFVCKKKSHQYLCVPCFVVL